MILKIEAKAVNFMEESFEACEKIQTVFESASSIPLTDGELLVYNQTNYSNENLSARIRVQIKGQEVKKFGESILSRKLTLLG